MKKIKIQYLVLMVCLTMLVSTSGYADASRGGLQHSYYYSFSLKELRSEETKQKYGEAKITSTEENEWTYEDELIRLTFLFSEKEIRRINFSLENKIDRSIKMLWNEAAYLDENNASHRVIHCGIRYIERDQPLAPSTIIPGSKLEDIVYPVDYVDWKKFLKETKEWIEKPLLPAGAATLWNPKFPSFPTTREEAVKELEKRNDKAKELKGKKIGVLLPLQVDGIVNEYIFTFEITDIRIERKEL